MTDSDAEQMFDQAAARHAPDLRIAVEDDTHRPFLDGLFVACSPLSGVLPDPMVLHQAAMRETGYRADFPTAMRRIVLAGDAPVGRIVIDWSDPAWLVDVAVLPERQGTGMGTALLHAYLEVADRRGQPAILQVMRDNPAIRLYTRLGFAAAEAEEFAPHLDMVRPPRGG